MTSHNKQHGGLHVVLGESYKNAHNFIQKKSNVSRNFLYGLSMSSSPNLNIHLLWVFFSFKQNGLKSHLLQGEDYVCN